MSLTPASSRCPQARPETTAACGAAVPSPGGTVSADVSGPGSRCVANPARGAGYHALFRALVSLTQYIRRSARQPGLPDGWLAARRTGCSASGHSRSQRPCQRFGSAGERAHSPRRAWLSLHRAVSGCGGPVSREDRASRPVQEALPRVPGSGPRAGPRCQAAARASPALALRVGLRSGAAGTSPPAISLAEHRVEFGVGPDRPDLLRAAAGDGDLGGPPQRLLA
jgi:hypothetical protein